MRINENWVKCYSPEETTKIFKGKVNSEAENLKKYLKENSNDLADYV